MALAAASVSSTREPFTPEGYANKSRDINLDGVVNVRDITLIQKVISQMTTLTELQTALSDVTGDGQVSISDATAIQFYIAQYTTGTGNTGEMYSQPLPA